jgi:hypothetical protein
MPFLSRSNEIGTFTITPNWTRISEAYVVCGLAAHLDYKSFWIVLWFRYLSIPHVVCPEKLVNGSDLRTHGAERNANQLDLVCGEATVMYSGRKVSRTTAYLLKSKVSLVCVRPVKHRFGRKIVLVRFFSWPHRHWSFTFLEAVHKVVAPDNGLSPSPLHSGARF